MRRLLLLIVCLLAILPASATQFLPPQTHYTFCTGRYPTSAYSGIWTAEIRHTLTVGTQDTLNRGAVVTVSVGSATGAGGTVRRLVVNWTPTPGFNFTNQWVDSATMSWCVTGAPTAADTSMASLIIRGPAVQGTGDGTAGSGTKVTGVTWRCYNATGAGAGTTANPWIGTGATPATGGAADSSLSKYGVVSLYTMEALYSRGLIAYNGTGTQAADKLPFWFLLGPYTTSHSDGDRLTFNATELFRAVAFLANKGVVGSPYQFVIRDNDETNINSNMTIYAEDWTPADATLNVQIDLWLRDWSQVSGLGPRGAGVGP